MSNDNLIRPVDLPALGEVDPAASATDMTGLVQAQPMSDEVANSYEDLLPVHRQKPADTGDVIDDWVEWIKERDNQ
ncbi:MAG: hypothetical protein Q4D04_11275 [Clostridia bacterium]|nr:hypothetical protein [Clostridia bacterium]